MGLERLAAPAAKSVLQRLGQAIVKPVVPELVERGTAAAPKLLEEALASAPAAAQRHAGSPYHGVPEAQGYVRGTDIEPPKSIEDWVQEFKTTVGAFVRHSPNLASDIQKTIGTGKARGAASRGQADALFRKVYEPLTKDPVNQTATAYDFLIHADEVAQAGRMGKPTIQNIPIEKWMQKKDELEKIVQADPEIAEVLTRRRALLDDIWERGLARGWWVPEHYLEEYTPIRRIHTMAKGLARLSGEDVNVKLLDAQMHRTGSEAARKTNLLLLEHDVVADFLKKEADHEMMMELLDDPTINFTSRFKVGDSLPPKLLAYDAGPGMAGRVPMADEDQVAEGFFREIKKRGGIATTVVTPGSLVMPKDVVHALMKYQRGTHAARGAEAAAQNTGKMLARNLSTYNPVVTTINFVSDFAMAAGGLPGESADPVGLLRFTGTGINNALKIAFNKGKTTMKLNGQEIDIKTLVENEGLAEATLLHETQGTRISEELQRLMPEAERSRPWVLFDFLQKVRLAGELSPRIAAGLAAAEKKMDIREFGRVGREITLTYGAQGPEATKMPLIRIMSPFLQFTGLAAGRTFDMLKAPESRTRTIAMIAAVPLLTWKWNTRNPEFQKVEDSLSPHVKSQAHVIAADPRNISIPLLDIRGNPVVIPFRFMVPEEVMKMVGLGNIAARVDRVRRGRDTPADLAKEAAYQGLIKTPVETLTMMPGFISDLVSTDSYGNKKLTGMDRVQRLLPMTRPIVEGVQTGMDYGVEEGLKTAAARTILPRPMNVMRRGKSISDSDKVIAIAELNDAVKHVKKMAMNGSPSEKKQAKQKLQEAKEKLHRIMESRKNEKEERNE